MFISKERKKSSVPGTGIQYIPGHIEKFVDLIIDTYLPSEGKIVDLGGGGLRFAIPVVLNHRMISVVDLDKEGLEIATIKQRIEKNNNIMLNNKIFEEYILLFNQDVFHFLNEIQETFQLVTAFRLLHFFSPEKIYQFFELVTKKIEKDGLLIFSGITFHNLPFCNECNEIFINSVPVESSNIYYRHFTKNSYSKKVKDEQNLPDRIHLFDNKLVTKLAKKFNYEILLSGFPSTRIVAGYILKYCG